MLVTIKLYDEVSPNQVLDLDLAAMKEETQELSKQVKLLAASIAGMKVSSGLSLECPCLLRGGEAPDEIKTLCPGDYGIPSKIFSLIMLSRATSSVTSATPRPGPKGWLGL